MPEINFKRYGLYLARWQLSTPILAVASIYFAAMGQWIAAIVANITGGLIFFWVDQYIFTHHSLSESWEVRDSIRCSDCSSIARGYRLVKTKNYDKTKDKAPKFRCEDCSTRKIEKLRKEGKI